MHVRARPLGEAFEEILHELRLQIADARHLQMEIHDGVGTAAEIDRGDCERFVHRHHEVPGAIDAPARAERAGHRLAKGDPHVLDGVMLVDVEIPVRLQREIERAMARDELEHVIEEPDAGRDVVAPLALDGELQANGGLARLPVDQRAPHTTSRARRSRRVSSTTPA